MFTANPKTIVSALLLFAPRDRELAEELETHLHLVPGLEVWHEGKIPPGANRQEVIDARLRISSLVLLLVGPDLLAAPAFHDLMKALEPRRLRAGVQIVPILTRASSWQHSVLSGLTALPRNGRVVSAWGSRDEAWVEVAAEVKKLVDSMVRDETADPHAQAGGSAPRAGAPTSDGSASEYTELVAHPTQEQLLDALHALLPGQWDELLGRLGTPTHVMSSASVPPATRAREILALMSQDGETGLDRLATVLERVAPGLLGKGRATGGGHSSSDGPSTHRQHHAHGVRARGSETLPVLILTALPLECRAVLRHLTDIREEELESGTLLEVGAIPTSRGNLRVGVVEVGAGNIPTAATAQEVFGRFRPAAVLFVGVAGGLKDARVGDVVAATRIYGFESGKAGDDFLPRPDVGKSSHRLIQRARAVARQERWRERLETSPSSDVPPEAWIGPMAAGSQVVASTRSPLYQFLVRHYSDALAVEMEGRGFLEAAWRNQIDALVVRGISDLIDKKAESDATGSQPLAARNAAAFAIEVIANLTLE